MKILKYNIILFLFSLGVISCVNDDGVFEETPKRVDMQESIAIVSVLQQLRITGMVSEDDLCFRFTYPLNLGYNTGASIEVKNFGGFKEMVFNQTSGFNVSKIDFPFSVQLKSNEQIINVANEAQFNQLVSDCGFSTVRKDILDFLGTCFSLEYPIKLKDAARVQKDVSSEEQLRDFILNQGTAYQPDFIFPFELNRLQDPIGASTITSNFDLITFLKTCTATTPIDCPEGEFDITPFGGFNYIFDALDTDPLSSSYEWSINGVVIEELRDQKLVADYELLPGTYEICLKSDFSNDGCEPEVISCQNFVVDEICTPLSFTRNTDLLQSNDLLAPVTRWFVDGQEVLDITDSGLFLTELDLLDGFYEICLESVPDMECSEVRTFCDMVEIDFCPPPISFTFEPSTTLTFTFVADFPERDEEDYEWRVDNDTIERDGGSTPDSDNQLIYTFPSPGTYEVCMFKLNGPKCANPSPFLEFCETIIVP